MLLEVLSTNASILPVDFEILSKIALCSLKGGSGMHKSFIFLDEMDAKLVDCFAFTLK